MFETIQSAIEFIGVGGLQTTVVLGLLIAVLYFRKALGLGSVLSSWARMVSFSLVVLLGLVLIGVVPKIDVDAGQAAVSTVVEAVRSVWEVLRG